MKWDTELWSVFCNALEELISKDRIDFTDEPNCPTLPSTWSQFDYAGLELYGLRPDSVELRRRPEPVMTVLLQLFGSIVIALVGVVSTRVLLGRFVNGGERVREVREEGGGVLAKLRGELLGGAERASSSRDHGLHMSVSGNRIRFRSKSVVGKHG